MRRKTIDKPFLVLTLVLVFLGLFIFSSASLGLLAREGFKVSAIAIGQIVSLFVGMLFLVGAIRLPHKTWNKYAIFIFIGSALLTLAVFLPGIGFSHGGATRWLSIGAISFQPAELLKLGFIVYFASWLSGAWRKIGDIRYGILPLVILLGIVGGILAFQPDIGTFIVIAVTGVAMFVAGGGKWRHIISFGVLASGAVLVAGSFVPYIKTRLVTFISPGADPLGASYQLQQSLIAVGSGKWFGRGFGQSVQKFNFLPEPVGDSIFAVFAEEWGFVGASILVLLFILLALRGYKIASRAPSMFSGLLVVGIVTSIVAQSFINISSMLGIFPLTGMPLLFVSQGGSALMVALLMVGIVLNVSKSQQNV